MGEGISEFLADGIIHLETYFDKNEVFRRRLRILKMRGTNHTRRPHEYDITSEGFVILNGREKVKGTKRTSPKPLTFTDLSKVKGIGSKRAEILKSIGINSAENLIEADPEFLSEKLRISERMAYRLIENARKLVYKR